MFATRRRFLKASLGALAVGALPAPAAAARKKLLLLGGTGFLGPAVVEAARAGGHAVTLFNRGRTRPATP